MADVTILQLPTLSAAAITGADILPIVDISDLTDPDGTTKGVLASGLTQYTNRHNGIFNVTDPSYGAIGNGIADDTLAFQAAITAANSAGNGIVFIPLGYYVISSQLIIPPGVTLLGCGMGSGATFGSRILWTGASGFCFKAGNTASSLSYGINLRYFGINIQNTAASGIWMYGTADSILEGIYVEGQTGTTTSIGIQIDGANISAFGILMNNVICKHVFKGFVHTTTGTTQPTQVNGFGCSAFCDNTPNSKGIDIQSVGGVGCGDGVTYIGGDIENCAIGANLNASGTSLIGLRFENSHANVDVKFDTLARCNQIIGGANVFNITNVSGSKTNQILAVGKDASGVVSQQNMLDAVTIGSDTPISFVVDGTNTIYAFLLPAGGAAYAGRIVQQAGDGSASHGGALNLYGHAHATHPGDVVAGISTGSGGKFRVNANALDGGGDWLVVSSTTVQAPAALQSLGAFGVNGAAPQTPLASGGAAPAGGTGATAGAYDTAAHRDALITLVNNMRTALVANGIMT